MRPSIGKSSFVSRTSGCGCSGAPPRADVDVVAVEGDVDRAELDLEAGELVDQAAEPVGERHSARVDADEGDRVELRVPLDDLVRDPPRASARGPRHRERPARPPLPRGSRRAGRGERTAGVHVHVSPFRPHGTGLKERCGARLSGPEDVIPEVRRLIAACLSGLVLAAAAGCGGSGSGAARSVPTVAPPVPLRTAAFGQGAARYWIWHAAGKPHAVVLFLHGLDYSEIHPANHLVWIEHLARKGDDVIYPAYEAQPGQLGALRRSLSAVNAALQRLGRPSVPFVIVGYSRGGRLAVELAAVAPAIGVVPAAVMSVFPSRLNPIEEEVVDLGSISPTTRIVLAVGEEDSRERRT